MDDIIELMKENNGYITTKEINKKGINRFYLSKLVNEGKIQRIKRGLYCSPENLSTDEHSILIKIVPHGVMCLMSAVSYFGLTSTIPTEYSIAIPKKSKIKLPEYPPIQLHYFLQKDYDLGILTVKTDAGFLRIYEVEKSICDIVRYKSRIGSDIIAELFKNYMKQEKRDIQKLISYAKQTNTLKHIQKYLDVLL